MGFYRDMSVILMGTDGILMGSCGNFGGLMVICSLVECSLVVLKVCQEKITIR